MYTIKLFGEVSLYILFEANRCISYLHVYLTADSCIFIHRMCHNILTIHTYIRCHAVMHMLMILAYLFYLIHSLSICLHALFNRFDYLSYLSVIFM